MSVSRAVVGVPAPVATSAMLRASSRDASVVGMNAPSPTLTSMTRASRPAASFLERMEAVMRPMDSTVAVTSRMA